MEMSTKIQQLRKGKGMTQAELAQALFVSRTAVSKWETGHGMPNIESLRALSKLFSVTLEELLSVDELVKLAENENRENMKQFSTRMNALLNLAALITMFLPLYKQSTESGFLSVALYQINSWQSHLFALLSCMMALCGLLQFTLRDGKIARCIGLWINIALILVLILCGQPYPAVLFFCLFCLKGAAEKGPNTKRSQS